MCAVGVRASMRVCASMRACVRACHCCASLSVCVCVCLCMGIAVCLVRVRLCSSICCNACLRSCVCACTRALMCVCVCRPIMRIVTLAFVLAITHVNTTVHMPPFHVVESHAGDLPCLTKFGNAARGHREVFSEKRTASKHTRCSP